MKCYHLFFLLSSIAIISNPMTCQAQANKLHYDHKGDTLTTIRLTSPTKYLILPIQETANEVQVCLQTGKPTDVPMDIRLAIDSINYYVPFALTGGNAVSIRNTPLHAICWGSIYLSNTFDTSNYDDYRPAYHHSPPYGWMNDPNGMIYKDGEYHLYYQYNPYGSRWGNLHWGHSVSQDLIHWKQLSPVLSRDTLGHIFSGSTVIDKHNTAGYGKNALIAFYTSASDKYGQIQCMAFSTDNGYTFTKYEGNPILTPFDGLRDFRDPKVFWYEPDKKWIMVLSADKEIRFYSSRNLKEWEYMSAFGRGFGAQPSQFECPDFVQMPVDNNPNHQKWVLIVNINPGGMFGGSATEYFIGDFDGKKFICDTPPEVSKWMDYGKDHYAAVCFSNTGSRAIAIPWMNNWQYANITPNKQFRGINGLPRELSLYSRNGQIYMASNAIAEAAVLRKDSIQIPCFNVEDNQSYSVKKQGNGLYELSLDITPGNTRIAGLELTNRNNEKVNIYLDFEAGRLVMDRTESGITKLTRWGNFDVHAKETSDHRKTLSINYKNDYALGTWAPLSLCNGRTYHLRIFIDKCSIEIFMDNGRIAMTNLVFPTSPYDSIRFYSTGGQTQFKNLNLYNLGL